MKQSKKKHAFPQGFSPGCFFRCFSYYPFALPFLQQRAPSPSVHWRN